MKDKLSCVSNIDKMGHNRWPIRKPLSPKGLRPWDYLVSYLPICP